MRRYRTAIIYSGPTSLLTQLYLDNFEYFLKHGLPSSRHGCRLNVAVLLVLTSTVLDHYADSLAHYNATCGEIQTLTGKDGCYDMESARIALASRPNVDKLRVGTEERVWRPYVKLRPDDSAACIIPF